MTAFQRIRQLVLSGALALTVFASRFASLPANFSPLGSFGFFGKQSWLFFTTIIAHDYMRGGFYPGFWLTYLGFAMYVVLGRFAGKHWKKQAALLPVASFLFFIFSNLGVWWYWYPHSLESLITCYTLALPFYRNTFLGDVLFGYGYMFARRVVPLIMPKLPFAFKPLITARS